MNRLTVTGELNRLLKVAKNAKDIDEETLDIYLEDLADLPEHLVIQALGELRKSITFFPSIGEIRDRVVSIVGESILVDPESAFGEVMREVKRVGAKPMPVFQDGVMYPAPSPRFSSPMIAKAVEAIGWTDFCLVEIENMGTLRAQFRDALRAIQRREVDRIVSGRAIGNGLDALSPITIVQLPEGERA
jgi:hypothetical protein